MFDAQLGEFSTRGSLPIVERFRRGTPGTDRHTPASSQKIIYRADGREERLERKNDREKKRQLNGEDETKRSRVRRSRGAQWGQLERSFDNDVVGARLDSELSKQYTSIVFQH